MDVGAQVVTSTPADLNTRLSEVLLRIAISQSIINSALEIPRSFDVVQERSLESHRSGQSGVLDILLDGQIKGISSRDELDPFLKALALQTTVNAEMVISAAAIILSHSTADDVFTAACQMAIDLEPREWISELNLKRTVSLETLKEKGGDRVFADELRSYRDGLGGKSLPTRADLLFGHVLVKLHSAIPKEDVAYFRLSRLKEVDELRHRIVHGDGIQKVRLKDGIDAALFLHEAAQTALRSLANKHGFTPQREVLFKGLAEKEKA
jgi:hypothetical protein